MGGASNVGSKKGIVISINIRVRGVEPPRTAYMFPWARWAGGQAVSRTSLFLLFPFPFLAGGSLAGWQNRYVCLKRAGGQVRMLKKSGRKKHLGIAT